MVALCVPLSKELVGSDRKLFSVYCEDLFFSKMEGQTFTFPDPSRSMNTPSPIGMSGTFLYYSLKYQQTIWSVRAPPLPTPLPS